MNEAIKHTPGPWTAGRSDMATLVDGVESKWIYAGEQYVAVASGQIDGDWQEVMANAHLIAATPDLLTALKRLRDDVQAAHVGADERCNDCAVCWSLKLADAAIAKAEGGHQ